MLVQLVVLIRTESPVSLESPFLKIKKLLKLAKSEKGIKLNTRERAQFD